MARTVRRSLSENTRSLWHAIQHASLGEWLAAQEAIQVGSKSKIVRIPQDREAEHLVVCGSTGSGKTSVLMGIADHAEWNGETCIIYDPHRQYVERFYIPERGDVILNSTDARCAHWNPTHEVDYTDENTARATSLALAASLYPGHPGQKDWFFTDAARRILVRALVYYRPNAQQLAELYTHIDPLIDAIAKGTDLETMLTENAGPQRAGIQATATQCLPALIQIPEVSPDRATWSAREFEKTRRGWVFLTAKAETRVALRPLHSMWLDFLILRLIDGGEKPELPKVRVLIDELPTLQQLPNLRMALQESRKSGVMVAIGFHAKSDLRGPYQEEADSIISAPTTKIILRTGEPEAQEWAAKVVGSHDVERLREHVDSKGAKSYTTERSNVEPLVMATQFRGLAPRVGFLVHADYATKIKFCYPEKRNALAEGFIQAIGKPVVLLPMPNLEEILKQKEEEKKKKAEQAAKNAAAVLFQPMANPAAPPEGSAKGKKKATAGGASGTTQQQVLAAPTVVVQPDQSSTGIGI